MRGYIKALGTCQSSRDASLSGSYEKVIRRFMNTKSAAVSFLDVALRKTARPWCPISQEADYKGTCSEPGALPTGWAIVAARRKGQNADRY